MSSPCASHCCIHWNYNINQSLISLSISAVSHFKKKFAFLPRQSINVITIKQIPDEAPPIISIMLNLIPIIELTIHLHTCTVHKVAYCTVYVLCIYGLRSTKYKISPFILSSSISHHDDVLSVDRKQSRLIR